MRAILTIFVLCGMLWGLESQVLESLQDLRKSCDSSANSCYFEELAEKSKLSLEKRIADSCEVINCNLVEFLESNANRCHFERSEKSKLTPPPSPLPQGEGESLDFYGLSPTYFLEKSKQKTLDCSDSQSEILPTLNPQNCVGINDSCEFKNFCGLLLCKSPWGLGQSLSLFNFSPSLAEGVRGWVISQNFKDSRKSQEFKKFFVQKYKMLDSHNSTQSTETYDLSKSSADSPKDSSNSATEAKTAIDSQDSSDSPQITADSQNSQDSPQSHTFPKADKADIFSPAQVFGDTFGAFAVGYQAIFKTRERPKSDIFFALDRGWVFVDKMLLFALSLDGSAGEFYSINFGTKLGVRAFSGRIIPSFSISYGLLNHKISGAQHNLHGATATIALFVDIASGFGAEIAYRASLYRHPTIKRTGAKVGFHSFMINVKFIDFNI